MNFLCCERLILGIVLFENVHTLFAILACSMVLGFLGFEENDSSCTRQQNLVHCGVCTFCCGIVM